MTVQDLISPDYLREQVRLHAQPNGYGGRGRKWSTKVQSLAWTHDCQSVLDYGCGEGSLVNYLQAMSRTDKFAVTDFAPRVTDFREYDPAIDGKDALPASSDLVVCTDVLEHIEPDKVDAVLTHLCGLARKALFVVISLIETAKTLSDGRQAHILLRDSSWWRAEIAKRGFLLIEEPQVKPEKQWVAVFTREASC